MADLRKFMMDPDHDTAQIIEMLAAEIEYHPAYINAVLSGRVRGGKKLIKAIGRFYPEIAAKLEKNR